MSTKSILLSIQPQYVAKILNGEKTIEIRKKFPADYRGWVYIYCTKNIGKHGENQLLNFFKGDEYFIGRDIDKYNPNDICYLGQNGKVVGRFWCDRVEEIECRGSYGIYEGLELNDYYTDTMDEKELFIKSCLRLKDFNDYLDNGKRVGYAIHITQLKIFNNPKEISELMKPHTIFDIAKVKCKNKDRGMCNNGLSLKTGEWIGCNKFHLSKAPQNYCYIEEAV